MIVTAPVRSPALSLFLPSLFLPGPLSSFSLDMAGSFILVDDHDIDSINYTGTPSLWTQGFLNGAEDGTITQGIAGAKATFNFTGMCVVCKTDTHVLN